MDKVVNAGREGRIGRAVWSGQARKQQSIMRQSEAKQQQREQQQHVLNQQQAIQQ